MREVKGRGIESERVKGRGIERESEREKIERKISPLIPCEISQTAK